jgi:hypothetical protein
MKRNDYVSCWLFLQYFLKYILKHLDIFFKNYYKVLYSSIRNSFENAVLAIILDNYVSFVNNNIRSVEKFCDSFLIIETEDLRVIGWYKIKENRKSWILLLLNSFWDHNSGHDRFIQYFRQIRITVICIRFVREK